MRRNRTSPYINPMVTEVKKVQTVRLCLDARKINAVTVQDHEGAIPIDQVLANCGKVKVMSSIAVSYTHLDVYKRQA